MQPAETSQPELPITQQTQHRQLAITGEKRSRTDGEIIINKSKLSNRYNNIQSNQSNFTNLPNINTSVLDNHDDEISNEDEFIFITQQNQLPQHLDYHRNLTSISSFIQQNQIHSSQKLHHQSVMTTPTGTNHHMLAMSHISEHHYPQMTVEPETSKYLQNLLTKSRGGNSKKPKEVIQPNPTATSFKYKGPVKGLAYKDVKERIIDKVAPINSLSYFTSNLDDAYLEQLNKEDITSYDLGRLSTNARTEKKRLDYKNMLKKIRKGITKTSTGMKSQQSLEHHNQNQAPVKLARSERTTSAYIAFNNRNRLQQNDLMLNTINSSSDFNAVSIEKKISKRNKVLQVKGDKISVDVIITEPPTFTSLVRHKSNLSNKNGLNDSHTSKHVSVVTTFETHNTFKYNLDKNYLRNTHLKSPDSSLAPKSSFSSYSILGLAGKRINPTPDYENTSQINNMIYSKLV